ncbi:MAG: hypothetical protein ACFFG0_34670 [Candidatus Thorarchaeota archaeon]
MTEVVDPLAKEIFKSEIIKRYENGSEKTRYFLVSDIFMNLLTLGEWMDLILNAEDFVILREWIETYRPDSDPLEMMSNLISAEHIEIRDKRFVKLDFSGQSLKFEEFPKAFYGLRHLEVLYFGHNYKKELPDDLYKLGILREFSISTKQISQIPDSLCEII